ncbi:hypothetical protein ACEQ8H_003624 [Pleosporales sp. CAS-2024a]
MSGNHVEFGGLIIDVSQLNFNDHRSRVNDVRYANIVLIVLVIVTVCLRLFARIKFVKRIFPDDILIVLAAVFTLTLASTCIAASFSALGTHIWLLPVDTAIQSVKIFIKYLLVCQVLYACAIGCTKVAIISSYLRFINDSTFSIAMYLTLFITGGLWICGIFVTIFQCSPVSSIWENIGFGKCIDYISYLYASAAINVFTDIVLCVLPVPHLWSLKMPMRQRIILCLLFVGGAGACIAGLIRIAYLHKLRILDLPFQSVPSLLLTVVECSLGIISVSIPAIRPLVVRFIPSGSRQSPALSITFGQQLSQPPHSKHIPLSDVSGYPKTTRLATEHEADARSFRRLSSMETPS